MKYQIPIIVIAVFSISILLGQIYVDNRAYAITIETATFGAVAGATANVYNNCAYVSVTEVWCPSSTGLKIWNPTTRSLASTLKPTGVFTDVKCTSSVCYGWEASGTTGNLTRWLVSGHTLDDFQPFIGNTGFVTGHGIALVTGGDNTLLLPIEGQTCTDGVTPLGSADDKGICFWAGGTGATFDGNRWISAQTTNDLARVHDIEWNGQSATIGDPTANRAVVKYNDLAGVKTYQLINLADSDTTFITTRICETASLAFTNQAKVAVINGILFDSYSTSDLVVMDTTLGTCAVGVKTNLVDEGSVRTTTYDSVNDEFIISATDVDGGNENSAIYTFNGTTFDGINTVWEKELKVNTTATTNVIWTHFNHPSEGEIQVWRGNQMVIISDLIGVSGTGGQTTTICYVVQGTGQTFCKTYTLDENGNVILDSVIGGVNPRNITTTSGELFCSLGITDCSNPDIKTNGTGMFMLLILVLVSYALIVYIHHVAKQSVTGINPMLVLLIGIIDISIAFFLGWIPDYVFYSVVVVLIGLGGFGLYKMIRGQ